MSSAANTPPSFALHGSRQAVSWLREFRASIAFSTYQSGKLFLLGLRDDGNFSVFERTFERDTGSNNRDTYRHLLFSR